MTSPDAGDRPMGTDGSLVAAAEGQTIRVADPSTVAREPCERRG
jgi:hypothetical protein